MYRCICLYYLFFFFNDTATTEIYTLSLHDALPTSRSGSCRTERRSAGGRRPARTWLRATPWPRPRSEEHTSELQSHVNLVCRLLLEKKKNKIPCQIIHVKKKNIKK